MSKALAQIECKLFEAADGRAALEIIRGESPDLVYLDLNMPGFDGLAVLRELANESKRGEIIVVTANDGVACAVECMRLGATDYITKPFEVEQIRAIARRNAKRVELEERAGRLQSALEQKTAFGSLIGVSQPMRELFSLVERAAKAPLDILVRGETGTGKELVAKEIHRISGRTGPFVAVNTAAISSTLAESELFGHVKGAFTGADSDRKGVFEQAHGGTIFLDEVGDMPSSLQAKMLRVLQERIVQRVGSSKEIRIDVRVISATHQDLHAAIIDGLFRQDLLYRIRGVEVVIPPLRSRPQDIGLLAEFFLDRLIQSGATKAMRLSTEAMEVMLRYSWPGNVRELEHVITAAASLSTQSPLTPSDLAISTSTATEDQHLASDFKSLEGLPLTEAKAKLVDAFERHAITSALRASEGNISAAARSLGIHRQNLQQKMAQLNIK